MLIICCHSCLCVGVKNFFVTLVTVNLRYRQVCSIYGTSCRVDWGYYTSKTPHITTHHLSHRQGAYGDQVIGCAENSSPVTEIRPNTEICVYVQHAVIPVLLFGQYNDKFNCKTKFPLLNFSFTGQYIVLSQRVVYFTVVDPL